MLRADNGLHIYLRYHSDLSLVFMCTKIYCVDRYKVLPQGVILESLNHTAAVVDVLLL